MIESETLTGKRVLLVDDQSEVRMTIRLLLELEGHHVTEAADGQEALALYDSGEFDIVITDYLMPGMRGDELACHIKQADPAQPILMVTGSGNICSHAQNPVEAVLNKPFSLSEMRQALACFACSVPA